MNSFALKHGYHNAPAGNFISLKHLDVAICHYVLQWHLYEIIDYLAFLNRKLMLVSSIGYMKVI